ncbi:MAG: NAD(P)/FAD-dependent oxidoreductase [Bacteroidales bacterium]
MIRVEEVATSFLTETHQLLAWVATVLQVESSHILEWSIANRAIDSRNKNFIRFIYTLDIRADNEEEIVGKLPPEVIKKHRIRIFQPFEYQIPRHPFPSTQPRPVVVGCGPAGLFAALVLARAGLNPLIIERGEPVEKRTQTVEHFFASGELHTESNVQFGEGGAGTFSDGKLYTLVNDPRTDFIFRELVKAGAPESILWDAKPHIGTDHLRTVVKNLRKELEALGASYLFSTALTDLIIENHRLKEIILSSGQVLPCKTLVLATGHSARDTFEMLYRRGVQMEPKIFAVGVRIEHLREWIDRSQYGRVAGHPMLGAARYKLAVHPQGHRPVYTFCMCPGGYVVAAASESNRLVTNGMSYYNRDNVNSNSALLVNVLPEDLGGRHLLAGVEFQRKLEEAAYKLGGGKFRAPAQRVEDFLKNRPSKGFGDVTPSYQPGVKPAHLGQCLPKPIVQSLRAALPLFDQKIKGFCHPDAVLTAVESRSTSPLRIIRDETLQSNIRGLYPAGEGAGYAGGIVSAALDGLRVAEALLSQLKNS